MILIRLPFVYVDNRAGVDLPFFKENGALLYNSGDKELLVSLINADADALAQMEQGDVLLRIYSSVEGLNSDGLYLGRDICPNCYFVLLTKEPAVFPDGFVVKKNLIYAGLIGSEWYMFNNWVRQITNDYVAHTYPKVMQDFIDSVPDMIWFKDTDEYHMMLNKAFCEVVGKPYSFCIDKLHPDIWDSSLEEYAKEDFICRQTERAVVEAGRTLEFEESVEKDGSSLRLKTYKTPLRDCYGSFIGTCGIGRDVTETIFAQHQVDTILRAMPFPVVVCDREYNIQRTNQHADRLIGAFGTSVTNYLVWKNLFLHPDYDAKHTDDVICTYRRGQETVYYSVYEQEIMDLSDKHVGYLCFLIDVTYERICQDIMDKAAYYDFLTDTKNRRRFYEDMQGYVGRPLSLIYCDLDHFKSMNDLYGHDAGDKVLKDCLQAIKECFGKDCVYRIGGDEFTVIVVDISDEELESRLENVKSQVRTLAREGAELGISFGISKTDSLQDVDEFIRESDRKMYRAKGSR